MYPFLKNLSLKQVSTNIYLLTAVVALYWVFTANFGFFNQLFATYPPFQNIGFVLSAGLVLFGVLWLFLLLVCYQRTYKIVLSLLFLIAALCAYFTDTYGTIFDQQMLINGLQTDQNESSDLMSLSFLLRVLILGVLPIYFIYKTKVKKCVGFIKPTLHRLLFMGLAIAIVLVSILGFGKQYASFFREHKQVRYYTNPITPIYSLTKLTQDTVKNTSKNKELIPRAQDAVMQSTSDKPKLMVFVVGETLRGDHFGLNGYQRNTTPYLSKQPDIFTFTDATSCGTSTAFSLPCMFSFETQKDFDRSSAGYNENVLDTLAKQGVQVTWRDNNSDSKGVATRVTYQDYKDAQINPVCDTECRDIGMLSNIKTLALNANGEAQNTLVVLHQMGNHGPAYYKRYPQNFEFYKPTCKTNELAKCDQAAVINTYDNVIRYTDYFLDSTINELKQLEQTYDVVLFFVSDHGESLGENNVYLHGLPYRFAPKAQKHIAMMMWSPKSNRIDQNVLSSFSNKQINHDVIVPSILSFFEIKTKEVEGQTSIIKQQGK